jgi:signal transduction histidine kinase
MDINLSILLTTLAEPPGDLIYHLVVSLALMLTVGFAFRNLGKSQTGNQAQRTLIGCGVILILQFGLFGLRFLNISTQTANFYTLYERLAAALTIAWLMWVFSDDDQPSIPTNLNIILSALLIILAGVSLTVFPNLSQLQNVNLLLFNLLWQFIAIALVLIGLVLAVFIPVPQRVVMVFILLMLASGHITQILMHDNLQWSMGAVRLAQTLSLPWVLVLIQRFSQPEAKERFQAYGSEVSFAEMPVDTKPALINLLLKVNLTNTVEEKHQAIAQALSLSVVADICYLVKITEQGDKLYIIAGYDLIRESFQNTDTLVSEDLPHIMDAWHANQVIELSQDQAKSRDALTLAMLLKYHGVGNTFAYPLGLPDNPLVGGVIFLSPYTGKVWGNKTRQLMDEIHNTLARILFAPNAEEQARLALIQVQRQVNLLFEEQEQLNEALADREAQIQEKEAAIKALKARYQIEKIETVTSIDRMKAQIADLSSKLNIQKGFANQWEQMKTEIRQLTNEREQLSLALSRANATIRDLQTQTGQTGPIRLSLDSQIISLDSIAANVRLRVASHLQQNDIDLEIHNPDGRQMIKTDPELLQSALLELITNAIKASELGGTIRLDQKLSLEMGMLIIQVTDFGSGLSQAEQTALFSAQYDTIPGIGDVHSIRNAIRAIRVLNGKIWLKSKKASYTTFRFQIPVRIID